MLKVSELGVARAGTGDGERRPRRSPGAVAVNVRAAPVPVSVAPVVGVTDQAYDEIVPGRGEAVEGQRLADLHGVRVGR